MIKHKILLTAALFCFVLSIDLRAQTNPEDLTVLGSWIAFDAPPGREHIATDMLLQTLRGWKRDALGNLILRKGSGSPRRVVACALDRPGFAVTEITDDGYLRLREVGAGRQHPLWVQFHEGQQIRIWTRTGPVPGVVTVKSTHLQRGRAANAPPATLDDLWVDVGATSRAEVQQLGIEMLDPVVRRGALNTFSDFVSGQLAGVRVGCAAVASAANGEIKEGETIFLLTTLRSFGHDGLEAALRSLGRVDDVTVVDQIDAPGNSDSVLQQRIVKPAYLPESTGLTTLTMLAPRVRFAGTLVETVQLSDAEKLRSAVEKAADVESSKRWQSVAWSKKMVVRNDTFSATTELLKTLADTPAVSGHEREVREAIIKALPDWARSRTRTDSEGNLILEVGPERDPIMFIAHQDEVGFEVTKIDWDGTVSLRPRGGLFQSLWEGQIARLYFDGGERPLTGVFLPRESATTKQPEALTAWFGYDGGQLQQRGVKTGMSVIAVKDATRLGNTRFTARALDDRAGSTALILAVRRITPALLKRKVIFAWSVREETGLEGAIALAKHYGALVK
jgi:putative aminopeptidase FrvX